MATAAELVAEPELDIDPITAETASGKGYTKDELEHFRIGHDDIEKLVIKIYSYGKKGRNVKKDLRRFITEAIFEDSIDQTPTFNITVHDPDWELLNTGALDNYVDINPTKNPQRWYRLGGFNVSDDEITLTFQVRNAVFLSQHHRPHKANRKKVTRAQFILSLVREVKKTRIKYFSPQLRVRQKVYKYRTAKERRGLREKGFSDSDKITIKGSPASEPQRRVVEKVITAGNDLHAPFLVIVAAVMAIIIESEANETAHAPGNPLHWGAFQQDPRWWAATMAHGKADAYKDAVGTSKQGFYDVAIPAWKKNPHQDLGVFIQNVQGATEAYNPGYAGSVNRWRAEAQHAVNAFSGLGVSDPDSTTQTYKKKYEFMVGQPDGPKKENYLEAIYRLAEEVQWRAFWVNDVLHFQSETDLYKAKARARLRRYENGVESVSFEWDGQKRINRMSLGVRMEKWIAPIGTVVVFDEGGPAQGRWLVTNIRRSVFDELGQIELSKPMRELKEPANQPGTRTIEPKTSNPSDPSGGTTGADPFGSLADIKSNWTPADIIYKLVVPKARYHGMTEGATKENVIAVNKSPTHVSGSDHYGPYYLRWAADMSNGFSPTSEMDDLASDLIMAFNMPDLAQPRATRGLVLGNAIQVDHRGFTFILIYRTDLGAGKGGNHYNHVHFGVRKISTGPAHQTH